VYGQAAGHIQPDLDHRPLEALTPLGFGDDIFLGADQLAVELFQDSPPGQVHRHVESGLPPQGRQ
jgi:hypothetical protein